MLNEHAQAKFSPIALAPPSESRAGAWQPSLSPMRVLYFAPKECWPPNTGARLRNYYLARELARHARVTYLGFAEAGAQRQEETAAWQSGREQMTPTEAGAPPLTDCASPCERLITG